MDYSMANHSYVAQTRDRALFRVGEKRCSLREGIFLIFYLMSWCILSHKVQCEWKPAKYMVCTCPP
jgi:hypothetical protein